MQFLEDKQKFNEFSKSLFEDLKNDPNYKTLGSWNSFAAKVAKHLLIVHNIECKSNSNINTLNQLYKESVNPSCKGLYELIHSSVLKGIVRDYSLVILDGIKHAHKTGDTELYEYINEQTDREMVEDFQAVLKELFSPEDELFSEREPMIESYGHSVNQDFLQDYYKMFNLDKLSEDHDAHYVFLFNAYLTLKELATDALLTFLTDVAESALDFDNYYAFTKADPSDFNDLVWAILEKNKEKYEKEIFGKL